MDYSRTEQLSLRQVEQLCELYKSEWWTKGRSLPDVQKMVAHSSFVFGLVTPDQRLVGFARVLSDQVYKALVLDVIVAADCRGEGLGAKLMEWITSHPSLQHVKHFELYCKPELRAFYQRWGFTADIGQADMMRRRVTR